MFYSSLTHSLTHSLLASVSVALSPNSQALRAGLPVRVKAVAYRNAKKRYFVPSKANYFGGIHFEYVMIDNGCNSTLYPFKEAVMTRFSGAEFKWKIKYSTGIGAVKSPTLVVKLGSTANFCEVILAGSVPLHSTNSMRFHLGTESAALLQNSPKLSTSNKAKLTSFLTRMGATVSLERSHVLLGQHYLQTVTSIQRGYLFLMCDYDLPFPTMDEIDAVEALVEPLLDEFEEFDDLEDEDHDVDDDEECSFECIDEGDNYM